MSNNEAPTSNAGAAPTPSGRSPLFIAFITIFLDLLGFGMMIPIQAFYAQEFGASAAVVTILGGSYSFMQFLFAPFWGRLSDRVGRRPIILFSVFISACGHFLFAMAGSLPMLFVARMIAGFGNANLGTAQAIISDVTTPENRAKGMGVIGAAFGLGFIFGPAIGGLLGQISPTAPSLGAGILAVANLLFAWKMLPETLRLDARSTHRRTFSPAAFRHAARHLNVGRIFVITFVFTTAFALMEHVIGLLIEKTWVDPTIAASEALGGHERISEAAKRTALFLVMVGITATIIQGGLIGKLQKKFGEVTLSRAGLVLVAISLALIPLAAAGGVYATLLPVAMIMAMGTGIFHPSNTGLLSRSIDADEQGGVLGLNQSLSSLGRVIGPLFAGLLFQWHEAAPFLIGAGLVGVTFVVALGLVQPQSRKA